MTTTMSSTKRRRSEAKRLSWLTEAQAVLGWGVILIMVALLGAIYLTQASRIAAVGRRVQVLQGELEQLKRENAELSREIAESQTLENLDQKAAELGLVQARPSDIEYIVVPNYPSETAEPSTLLATPEAPIPSEPAESILEAIWLSLKTKVTDFVHGEASEQ